jgi:pimeloyl-ACP methyl ester carboxylesterase
MADSSGHADAGGCSIAWKRHGTGPPVLFLNGYAATLDDWDPTFAADLSRHHELIFVDHRGMGGSEPGEEEVTVKLMASDALAVLDHLGLERSAVLGWSMGGFVAQETAMVAPERIEALILLSTDGGGSSAVRADPEVWARLTDHSGTAAERATRLIELLFPPDVAAEIEKQFGHVVAEARDKLSVEALSAQEAAMDRWHAEGVTRLPTFLMPVLTATGAMDIVIPPRNSMRIAEAVMSGWYALFEGGGHGFMAQQPRRLAALIRAFLQRAA